MKYDSSIVGEKVLNASGKEGKITKVSKEGAISVRFMGDAFGGEFMFDPFVSGHIRFVNPDLQKAVDKEIEEIDLHAMKFGLTEEVTKQVWG